MAAEETNIPVHNEGAEQPVQVAQEAVNISKGGGAVNSVNGMDGDVVLTAEDVGALPDTTVIPTVNDATLTIKRNGTTVATFTANSEDNKTADILVPTTVASLSDASDYAKKSEVDTIESAINKSVMTDLAVDSTTSTTVVQLDATKTNIKTSATTTSNIPLPVASSTQAGVMNSATYAAVTQNTSDINALINGAVAITGLAANPTQSQLTASWQSATGLTTLMNRAGIYDVTNTKYWTYYTNDTTWHYTVGAIEVNINTFTNSSEGTILGSTSAGQIFAENDGTGSVNGWDTLTSTVSDHTSKLAAIEGAASNYYTAAETDAAIAAAINNITDYDEESF